MPEDPIMDMVDNIEPMYNDKMAMFDRWVQEGDAWDKVEAHRQAMRLARHFATSLEEDRLVRGRYKLADYKTAADQMMEEFETYRDEAIAAAVKEVSRTPKPQDLLMDAGDVEHAKKYEEIAQRIGIDRLRVNYMPVSNEKVRAALMRGDKYLNSIPLRKWDEMANRLPVPGLSLSEKVATLKHVAKFHYA